MQHHSYGQELKTARERSGMSLQAVADALRLDPRLIEAIEGENAESLPAPAYVRGYIRAYAQLVRCEPETLIARYNTQAKSDPDLVASVHTVAAFKQQRDAQLMWVGTGIVVSLLMIVIGGWLLIENLFVEAPDTAVAPPAVIADSQLDAPSVPESWQQTAPASTVPDVGSLPPADVPAPDSTASGNAAGTASQAQAPAAVQAPAPAESIPPASAVQEPATASAVQPEPVPQRPVVTDARTGSDTLRLTLDGVSWIEVLDANGERLVYGLFDEQTRPLAVKGQAPFDVTIGDANHVDVSVNGQYVSSEPHIRRNNTARFIVESAASPQ